MEIILYIISNASINILNLSENTFLFLVVFFTKYKWFSGVLSKFLWQPLMNIPQNWSATPPCSRTGGVGTNHLTPLQTFICQSALLELQPAASSYNQTKIWTQVTVSNNRSTPSNIDGCGTSKWESKNCNNEKKTWQGSSSLVWTVAKEA